MVAWLGYCVLLADRTGVGALNDLDLDGRRQFLGSMAVWGEAVESAREALDPDLRVRRLRYPST